MESTKKPNNRRFQLDEIDGFEILHNIGPELGKAGEQLLADVVKAANYAFNAVQEKYPEVKETVKDKAEKLRQQAAEKTEKAKEAIKDAPAKITNFVEFLEELLDLADEDNDDCPVEVGAPEPCNCKKHKCHCGCGSTCCCNAQPENDDNKKDGSFLDQLRTRSQETAALESFVNLICTRARGYVKGENPVNTTMVVMDSSDKSTDMALQLDIYPKELHPTLTPLFDDTDIFGTRAVLADIADRLSFSPEHIEYKYNAEKAKGSIFIHF